MAEQALCAGLAYVIVAEIAPPPCLLKLDSIQFAFPTDDCLRAGFHPSVEPQQVMAYVTLEV